MEGRKKIMVQCITAAPVEKAWKYFTEPKHIENWNFASDDWECKHAENDLTVNGTFSYLMVEKKGAKQFEFRGTYTDIVPEKLIKYTIEDGRVVTVVFSKQGFQTEIIQTFEAEENHPMEDQQNGWQAILNNFKAYSEHPSTSV